MILLKKKFPKAFSKTFQSLQSKENCLKAMGRQEFCKDFMEITKCHQSDFEFFYLRRVLKISREMALSHGFQSNQVMKQTIQSILENHEFLPQIKSKLQQILAPPKENKSQSQKKKQSQFATLKFEDLSNLNKQEKTNQQFLKIIETGRCEKTPCLGCLQKIETNPKELHKQTFMSQNIVNLRKNEFFEQKKLVTCICAFLNSGGGFIIISEQNKGSEGYKVSQEDKKTIDKHLFLCFQYILPQISQEYQIPKTELIPLCLNPKSKEETVIVRAKIHFQQKALNLTRNSLFFTKISLGGKNYECCAYEYDDLQCQVKKIGPLEIYKKMHQKYHKPFKKDDITQHHLGIPCRQIQWNSYCDQNEGTTPEQKLKKYLKENSNAFMVAIPKLMKSGPQQVKRIHSAFEKSNILYKSIQVRNILEKEIPQSHEYWIFCFMEPFHTVKSKLDEILGGHTIEKFRVTRKIRIKKQKQTKIEKELQTFSSNLIKYQLKTMNQIETEINFMKTIECVHSFCFLNGRNLRPLFIYENTNKKAKAY